MSLQHPLVKDCVRIRSDKAARLEAKQVLLIGEKMVRELSSQIELSAVFSTDPNLNISAQNHYKVSETILQKITGLPAPDGVAAIAPMPVPQPLQGKKRILILDKIADPGNLGTLLRTALALNWDGVVFTPGTVDPFNDKALRASKGALFSLPYAQLSIEEVTEFVKPLYTYVADLQGASLSEMHFEQPLALILSNEGAGPDTWATSHAKKISIPMQNGVESLNVAISGAIILYRLS